MDFLGLSSSGSWSAASTVLWVALILWSLVWKGFAMWRAAKNNSSAWFVVLLVLNTVGILDILYLYFFSEMGKKAKV